MPFKERVILIHEENTAKRKQVQSPQDLHICPHELKVRTGDTVRWLYNELRQFKCVFKRDSPFGKDHKVIEGVNGSSASFAVTAAVGTFTYAVDERHMEEDPIIIVEPSIPK
jgi:plastocyanin